LQDTHGVVHAFQGTLGVLHGSQMTSVFIHIRQLWLVSPINRTMRKHSQHTTIEEQQEAREKESFSQERRVILIEFSCERNNDPIFGCSLQTEKYIVVRST
jgi:hypothetical protein